MNIKIHNCNYSASLEVACYSNGRTALVFYDAEMGEPIAKATVNLVDEEMAKSEIAISHDVAEDMIRELRLAGIITNERRTVRPDGSRVDFSIVRMTDQFCAEHGI